MDNMCNIRRKGAHLNLHLINVEQLTVTTIGKVYAKIEKMLLTSFLRKWPKVQKAQILTFKK